MRSHALRGPFMAAAALALGASTLPGADATRGGPSPASPPTFSKDVAPILYKTCVSCHRPGEMGPMSLISYSDVRPWAKSIRERVVARDMPPWHAAPQYGRFRNDRSLSQAEIDTIAAWVEGGARQGNPADMPRLPEMAEGWQIGQPDMVFEMPVDFHIPENGIVDYQTYNIPTHFTEDRWVVAAEVRVQDRPHVHHAVVTILEPEGNKPLGVLAVRPIPQEGSKGPDDVQSRQRTSSGRSAGTEHRLAGYAVGEQPPVWPEGLAKRVPAGSTLSFSMHYTTNGTPGKDRTKIGLVFAKKPPTGEIFMGLINNGSFEIPAGSPDTMVESEGTFLQDVAVWALHPHMHMRGKDMTYTAIYPDGRREVLLSVPRYHFDWQLDYQLAQPKLLPRGTKLRVTAHFDNSLANKSNPDAKATVHYGDQTWDEMMAGYLTYTLAGAAPAATGGAGQP